MTGNNHDQRLRWILDMIASVPEGALLLQIAEMKDVEIIMAPPLPSTEDMPGVVTFGQFVVDDDFNKTLRLNPRIANRFLVETAVHELRHVWQNSVLDFTRADELTPIDRFAFMRLIEGDAQAHAAYITRKINQAMKTKLHYDLHGPIAAINNVRNKDNKVFILDHVFTNYQDNLFPADSISHYEVGLIRKFSELSQINDSGLMSQSLSDTFDRVSQVLAIHGSHGKNNYLGAKDAEDFVRKIEARMNPDLRQKARQFAR